MELKRFGFIGLGLIGGSLAMALKRSNPDCYIMAYTRSPKTTQAALADRVINQICTSDTDPAFASCDCIFLCAPVGANIQSLKRLKDVASKDCILTDVGSVKSDIHKAVTELGLDGRFIGGHPMAGSEQSGYASAKTHLFENAYYIVTPSEGVPQEWIDAYRDMAASTGALPLIMKYQEHDYYTAAISHLPHLIAASLVNTVHDLDSPQEMMKLIAAGGFKDITRIASSSPEMWEHICMANGENISKVMDTFIDLLEGTRTAMKAHDGSFISKTFEKSREYRDSFSSVPMGPIKKVYQIYCDLVDEAGAIATIATMLAVNGISIKNIGIVHNREFEEGVLRIEFYEAEPSVKAAEILQAHHYQIWIR